MNQMPRALLPNIAEPRPAADDRTQFPQITILTKRDTPDHMSKRITLADDGTVKSDGSECRMITGTAAAVSASTASELARIIQNCGCNQAIALGALAKEIASPVDVTTNDRVARNPGSIARSRGYIDYQPGCPAWALIDFDS